MTNLSNSTSIIALASRLGLPNLPPLVASVSIELVRGQSQVLDLVELGYAEDPEGKALTFSLVSSPSSGSASITSAGVLTSNAGNVPGTYTYSYQASDGKNNADAVVTVVVSAYPVISVAAPFASFTEGDVGVTTDVDFLVSRSGANLNISSSVNWALSGSAGSADFVTGQATSGTITFEPGEVDKIITVQVIGDTLTESDETVVCTISSPTNASIGTSSATVTVTDDDIALSTLSITRASASINEGSSGGSTNVNFYVARTGSTGLARIIHRHG